MGTLIADYDSGGHLGAMPRVITAEEQAAEDRVARRDTIIELFGGWRPKPGQDWCCAENPAIWDGDDDN